MKSYDPKKKIYPVDDDLMSLEDLLHRFQEYGSLASDLHLKVGESPCYRLNGILSRFGPPLEKEIAHNLIFSILKEKERLYLEKGAVCSKTNMKKNSNFIDVERKAKNVL